MSVIGAGARDVTLQSKALLGVPTLKVDEAANDSDKTFTVAAGEYWEFLSIWIELITTATATVRQIELEWGDGGDIIGRLQAGVTQDASLTNNYLFAPGLPDLTSLRDSLFLMTPMPKIILPAGFTLRVFDNNAVDAAADDMVVQAMVQVYDIPGTL